MTVAYNASNAKAHLKAKHKDLINMASDMSSLTSSSMVTNSIISDYDSTVKTPANMKQNKLFPYKNNLSHRSSPSICLNYLYKFFNESNIAIEQANNQHLKRFIDLLLDHNTTSKVKREEFYFSRYKYKKYELESFTYFVNSIKNIICYSRNYYKEKLHTERTPFLYVSHDGWDSKDNDVLGVSIHLVVPYFWNVLNLAVGLKRVHTKKSIHTATAILIILER